MKTSKTVDFNQSKSIQSKAAIEKDEKIQIVEIEVQAARGLRISG